ncbi:MAG: hypothetical protein K9I26_03660 [Flavobacterium sp.]|nr:hypothetical protein [Flavobacterium sp.]
MNKIVSILILTFFVFSCSSDLDFDQTENVSIQPVIVSNLAAFEIQANEFVSGGIEETQFEDVPNFDLFADSFFKNNLTKIEFLFEINNTINRDFVVDLVLLDEVDSPLYTVTIPVPAYSGVDKLVLKTEVFETNLAVLTSTRKMSFTIRLQPGTLLTETSPGSLKLRSNVTGYFKIE